MEDVEDSEMSADMDGGGEGEASAVAADPDFPDPRDPREDDPLTARYEEEEVIRNEFAWEFIGGLLEEVYMPHGFEGVCKDLEESAGLYRAWLSGLGFKGNTDELPCSPEVVKVDILAIPIQPGRTAAVRRVTPVVLHEKMRALAVQQEWRDYDVAKFSILEDGSLFWEDGHLRFTAFHGLLIVFFRADRPVPEFLIKMATDIKLEITKVGIPRKEASSRAIAIGASLTHGVVPLGWLDVLLEVSTQRDDPDYADELGSLVQVACPECAKTITNFKHLKNLATRISQEGLEAIEKGMIRAGLPFHTLPMTWFRDPWMLLPYTPTPSDASPAAKRAAKRARLATPATSESVTVFEQVLAIQRILVAASHKVAKSNEQVDSANMLGRLLGEGERKSIVTFTKKLARGIRVAGGDISEDGILAILEQFKEGSLDEELRLTMDVEAQSHFWTFPNREGECRGCGGGGAVRQGKTVCRELGEGAERAGRSCGDGGVRFARGAPASDAVEDRTLRHRSKDARNLRQSRCFLGRQRGAPTGAFGGGSRKQGGAVVVH